MLPSDSIHQIIASTGNRYEKVIRALDDDNIRKVTEIGSISRGVTNVCRALEVFHGHSTNPSFVENEIEVPLAQLHRMTQPLFQDEVPHIRALIRAIDLFLFLLWPLTPRVDYCEQALDLKATLLEPHITLCGSLDLTVWQYFVGGIAAESDLETREWFVMRLKEMFLSMGVTQWQDVLAILRRGYFPDSSLLTGFMQLWREAQSSNIDS